MSLLFDPLYPTVVKYVVSQSIWELHDIHFWQLLFGMWGKNRAFVTLQHRYEKVRYEGRAIAFLIVVFAVSYLIQWLMISRQQNPTIGTPETPPNNPGVDHNQDRPNEPNVVTNGRNRSGTNPQPNPQNNE